MILLAWLILTTMLMAHAINILWYSVALVICCVIAAHYAKRRAASPPDSKSR